MAQLFPSAKVILHPLGKEHFVNPSRLIESTRMTYGDDFESHLGPILGVSESQIVIPKDGDTIPIGDRELKIIYAPGHAPHHIAIFDLKTQGLFCGEALGIRTKSAESSPLPNAAPPSFDMEAYIKTIVKLAELRPQALFYAHDGVGKNTEELISRAAENTKTFGDMILKALKGGEPAENVHRTMRAYVSTDLGISKYEGDRH